ncbi:DUF2163 domain-containing protein [Hyphobacterium sp.]|uniref:DUF2163 domain-containing protein n=1 Tax=Hyphobacterium sp. TaxID=2004662 RepID=UPI003BA8AA80
MLSVPNELQARLDGGVTTLCWCWRVERRDGQVFGFTDHDGELEIDGLSYVADSGLTGSELDVRTGRESATGEVAGVFDHDAITAADLRNGLWNGAMIEVFRVDWTSPALKVKTWIGEFGSISHDGVSYRAELHGYSRRLERSIGRIYSRHCDASFGDPRCGLDASSAEFHSSGTVSALLPSGFAVDGLNTYSDGWFSSGWLEWTSGTSTGQRSRVRRHHISEGQVVLTLDADQSLVEAGDTFDVVAGCDKRHATCRDKFSNIQNFRGFSLIPGLDALAASPASERSRDGGSRGTPT